MGLISRVSSRTYRRATAGLSIAKMVHSSELFSVRVGNEIPERTNEDDLRDKFEKYGKIGDVFIPKERGSDRGRGGGGGGGYGGGRDRRSRSRSRDRGRDRRDRS